MEQWYKDGEIFNSITAIRNYLSNSANSIDGVTSSLPMLPTEEQLVYFGFIKVVDAKPIITASQYLVEGAITLVNSVPTKQYTIIEKTVEQIQVEQLQAMQSLVRHFTDVTTMYIESKVQAYNTANGLAFKDIDAFTKYAINSLSQHYVIANKFINYADAIWFAVRTYQATATTVPTDAEFKDILDAVVF